MADENEDKKPEDTEEAHVAKVGVKDAGEVVTTAGGAKISGILADITDGDD